MSKKGGFGGVCGHAHDPCRLAIRAKPAQAEFWEASSSFGKAELGLELERGIGIRQGGSMIPSRSEQPIGEAKLSCREVASIFSPPFSFHTALAIRQGCVLFLSWPLRVDSWKEEIGAGTVRQGGAWGEAGFILFILPLPGPAAAAWPGFCVEDSGRRLSELGARTLVCSCAFTSQGSALAVRQGLIENLSWPLELKFRDGSLVEKIRVP
ncbi:unnamed protein product [Prunus armeniaca]|uniref:Uncharacterized protein n=1 Tax=Prunus armeniaca TaxID=36596 RepID=A0A6J5WSD0_PRUAR|nr:unnamed protein product [Prunus armeniaca]